jgi:hypothetical protein
MAINLVLAFFWLALALASLAYFLVHPAGGRIAMFGNEVSAMWIGGIGIVMFLYNMTRWWLARARKRERETMSQISHHTRRRPAERNSEFDFSEEPDQGEGRVSQ